MYSIKVAVELSFNLKGILKEIFKADERFKLSQSIL